MAFVCSLSLTLSSCGENDVEDVDKEEGATDKGSSKSLIVGTWYCGESEDDFDLMFVLNANGTGKGYEGIKEVWEFTYTYKGSTGMLTMYIEDYDETETYLVEFINNDRAILYEVYNGEVDREDGMLFKRVK